MSTTTVTLKIDPKTKTVISTAPETIKINTDEIPKHESDSLCRVLLRSTAEYFKRPGVQAEYEQWLAERNAKDGKM